MEELFASAEMAVGYARWRPAVHPKIVARIKRKLGGMVPVQSALDIGCGAGLSTKPLEGLAHKVYGIDPFFMMVSQADLTAKGALFAVARGEAIPFPDGSLQLLTAAGSLNYADVAAFFSEAKRVLAPGGMVAVYDFSQGRRFTDSKALADWFVEFQERYPAPAHSGRALDPEILRHEASDLVFAGAEEFDEMVELDRDAYVAYMMTETNVAYAIQRGVWAVEIRDWLNASLKPVFGRGEREVLFGGYVAYWNA